MRCLSRKVGSLGVKRTNSDNSGAASTVTPWITAAPNNIILPFGIAVGQTTIAWDGGANHPYAEIWVKLEGQNETKLLEQARGTLPVTVERGRTYLYILTDAGMTLATVTVRLQ